MTRLLYQLYKWLVYCPLFFIETAVCTLIAIIISLFDRRLASRWTGLIWSRTTFAITPARVRVSGRENIDPSQVYVIVSNHLSQYDIFVLYGWLGLDLRWVMKQELRRVPLIGVACQAMGYVFLDRSNPASARKSLQEANKTLQPGMSLVFFPEGTRSLDGQLKPFKKGAFNTAKDLDVAILPVTIHGTNRILPPATLDLTPGTASLTIHAPIDLDTVSSLSTANLADLCRETIRSGLSGADPVK